MTYEALIQALAEECRTTRTKIEDMLAALADLCAEALKKGERFNFGPGALLAVPYKKNGVGYPRAAVKFEAAPELRRELNIPDLKFPVDAAERLLCRRCKLREVQIAKECSTCMRQQRLERRGTPVQRPRRKTWKKKKPSS